VRKTSLSLSLFLFLTLLLAACGRGATPAPTGTPSATPPPTFQPTRTVTVTPTPAPVTVSIQNFAFVPADITVSQGAWVMWTNRDSTTHTVTGQGWVSGNLGQGQTYSYTFNTPGEYAYSCSFHPYMQGKVTVKSRRALSS
jgi:plastocyanin